MSSTITVYTSKTCSSCMMLKRFLSYKGAAYEEVNIDDHPERQAEAIELSGVVTVPVTVVKREDKQSVIVGYNLAQLAPALA